MNFDHEERILALFLLASQSLLSHQTSVTPSSQREANWIVTSSSTICWIQQWIYIFWIQLCNFSTIISPLYNGELNLPSNFKNGFFETIFLWGDGDRELDREGGGEEWGGDGGIKGGGENEGIWDLSPHSLI